MDTVVCPHCNHDLHLENDLHVGKDFLCPVCTARLEILSLSPLEVDWQFQEPERTPLSPDHMQMYNRRKYSHLSPVKNS